MNKQRNTSLDIAKAICAFLVVFIHAGANNTLETYFKVICTCAVPFFFLLSGYYLSLNVSSGKTEYASRQFKKIGELFIISNVLYAICISILMLIFHDDLVGFWKKCLTFETIFNFLVLNESPFGYHLWYIGAMLYALFIFNILISKNKINCMVTYMSLFLILGIGIGVYAKTIFKNDFPIYVTRNFIYVGIPSMAIGYMLPSILNKYHHLNRYALVSIIVCSMTIVIERFILRRLGILSTGSIFIMTVPLAVSIFIFAMTDEHAHASSVMKFLADIGRYDSANIYIYHVLFIFILNYMIKSENIIYGHIKHVLIFAIALAFSRGIQFAKSRF
jgi:peptidoglycan/LPS O-acetylase OafA/YrhL